MKICVSIVLLMLLCPGGCPIYDFDLRTIEQPSQFANGLKLAADLNSEYNNGIMNLQVLNQQDRMGGGGDESTCKLNAFTMMDNSNEDNPTRKLQFSRRVDDEEQQSDMEVEDFVGSNLFDSTRKKCFSPEDLNLMAARRDFEYLIPKDLPKCLLNDDMLNMLLTYFYNGNELIQRMPESSKKIMERAYYDMVGGYLRSYLMPVAKYSYYGGKTSLKVVSSVVELYQQCKTFLNTNGNGWKMPILLEEMDNVHVEPLRAGDCGADGGSGPTGCARLEMLPINDGDESVMLVSMPKLEADCIENGLSNIWIPFRKRRNYDLRSPKSAYAIMRFYATVTRCYQTQGIPQDTFNSKFITWINEYIRPHLSDEEFYPGLGGVLRIVEKLRKGRKALDFEEDEETIRNDEDDIPHMAAAAADDGHGRRMADDMSAIATSGGENMRREDDGFSDMELAQKALEYKTHEQAKQMMINSKRWFEKNSNENAIANANANEFASTSAISGQNNNKNFNINTSNNNNNINAIIDRQLQSRKCDKTKGQKGGSTSSATTAQQQGGKHGKPKTKCKQKGGSGGKHGGGGGGSIMKFTSDEQKHYLKYLCCIIGLILLILLIILLVAMLLRYRKRKPKPEKRPKPPKKKRKCPAWCNYLLCRKRPADEEIDIRPDTKSVITTHPHRRASTSTSSLACQPAAKCIPCSKRATKESESAPIIETTSLDYYSSSEPESKVRQKTKTKGGKQQKVVTIDEKKRKKKAGSPSPTKSKAGGAGKGRPASPKKGRLGGGADVKSSSSSDGNKRLGIQRTIPLTNNDNKKSSSETDTTKYERERGEQREEREVEQQRQLQQKERSISRDPSKGSRSWETMYET